MIVRSSSSYAYMDKALCRNRKVDGDAFRPDVFAQIARLDRTTIPDFDGRDIGADRADVVGDRFGQAPPRLTRGAYDGGVGQVCRPALLGGAIDLHGILGAAGGYHRRPGNSCIF